MNHFQKVYVVNEPSQSDPVHASSPLDDKTAETALPVVEAPAISPAAATEVPEVAVAASEHIARAPSSTERFRSAATAHIAAARERLAQRKSSPIVVAALIAGLAGAVATAGIGHLAAPVDQSATQARALDESMTRIEADLAALKGNVDRATKLSAAHAGKTGERLDRIEKARPNPPPNLPD